MHAAAPTTNIRLMHHLIFHRRDVQPKVEEGTGGISGDQSNRIEGEGKKKAASAAFLIIRAVLRRWSMLKDVSDPTSQQIANDVDGRGTYRTAFSKPLDSRLRKQLLLSQAVGRVAGITKLFQNVLVYYHLISSYHVISSRYFTTYRHSSQFDKIRSWMPPPINVHAANVPYSSISTVFPNSNVHLLLISSFALFHL